MLIHSAVITGSVQFNNTDVSSITNVAGFATTSSVDALVVKTGSYASTSSVNELQSKTGSYASTSSVNELQSKTGSYTSTSSFGAYTSSINTFTSSATTRLNTIESVTGSYASTSSVNNLQSVTGSFATTGSNQFNGNQSISGSIVSNGTITAQTLVVQTVTSSIEFVTGSTRNGSITGNTHQFTGSVLMSGSLNVGSSITANQFISNATNVGDEYYFFKGNSAVSNNFTAYSYSNTVYLNAYNSLYLRANNTGGSGGNIVLSGGNVGIGSSTSPVYKLEVSTAGGSERIRVGTLQNNNNTATFEAITSAGLSTATSGWIRAVYGGGMAIGTSTYTKTGGDSGNFANLSAESANTAMTVDSNGTVAFARHQRNNGSNWHVIPFALQKANGGGSTDTRTIVEITSDTFSEYIIFITYGARCQNISDSATNISTRMYGVNRFNSGAVAITESSIPIGGSGTINTHAPITAVASTSTKVIIKVDFSSSLGAASFVWGEIKIISYEGITPTIVNNNW